MKFTAVFLASPDSKKAAEWNALGESEKQARQKEGFQAWSKWMETHKGAIVFPGGPLGKTKRTDPKGVSDVKNNLTAYLVVEAESHEAAAKMFLNHPHFAIFPGDSVEIMEALPIPTMP